jgi:hypothetical protein
VDKRILDWLKTNKGKILVSPRKVMFRKNVKDFEIIDIDEKKAYVRIRFEERRHPALPLTFTMFDRAVKYVIENKGQWVRLGTSIHPQPNTIEGEIWKEPYPIEYKSTYKVASHICDILALSGIVEYGYTIDSLNGKRVQGVKYIE